MIVFSKIVCAKGVTAIVTLTNNQIVVGGGDGTVTLLYIDEPKCEILISINLYGAIYSLSPSFDGLQLLAATDKGFIYRVRAADLTNILLNENHTGGIISMFSLNDPYYRFGTTSFDGTIRLWNLNDYSVYCRIYLHPELIANCLVLTDDLLLSGWNDGKIRTFRVDDGSCTYNINIYINKSVMECR